MSNSIINKNISYYLKHFSPTEEGNNPSTSKVTTVYYSKIYDTNQSLTRHTEKMLVPGITDKDGNPVYFELKPEGTCNFNSTFNTVKQFGYKGTDDQLYNQIENSINIPEDITEKLKFLDSYMVRAMENLWADDYYTTLDKKFGGDQQKMLTAYKQYLYYINKLTSKLTEETEKPEIMKKLNELMPQFPEQGSSLNLICQGNGIENMLGGYNIHDQSIILKNEFGIDTETDNNFVSNMHSIITFGQGRKDSLLDFLGKFINNKSVVLAVDEGVLNGKKSPFLRSDPGHAVKVSGVKVVDGKIAGAYLYPIENEERYYTIDQIINAYCYGQATIQSTEDKVNQVTIIESVEGKIIIPGSSAEGSSGGSGGGDGQSDLITSIATFFVAAIAHHDPLVLDLDGDGIETIKLNDSNVYFDLDNDGFKEKSGWVSKDDGIFIVDENNNGLVDGVSELFGNTTINGFDELKLSDSNNDGKIDSQDADFSKIKIWQDLNENGISEMGKFNTLSKKFAA